MADQGFVKIRGKVYRTGATDELSLMDLMLVDAELAASGLPYRWDDLERIGDELSDLDDTAKARHPDWRFMMASMVWLAMRATGEEITLVEAARIPLREIEFFDGPKDHKKKAASSKPKRPKDSVAVESPPDDDAASESPTRLTSVTASTSA